MFARKVKECILVARQLRVGVEKIERNTNEYKVKSESG